MGTHKEMPLPVCSVMDGAPRFLAEAGMCFSMIQEEVVLSKELKLVDSESENPGDDVWFDGKGVVVFCNKGHVVVVK